MFMIFRVGGDFKDVQKPLSLNMEPSRQNLHKFGGVECPAPSFSTNQQRPCVKADSEKDFMLFGLGMARKKMVLCWIVWFSPKGSPLRHVRECRET